MEIRTVHLTVHVLGSGGAYWALSADRGRGSRFVLARGVLADQAEYESSTPLSLLQEAVESAAAQGR